MVGRPGTGWVVPRRLAAVGEVATMATTVGRLLGSVRAERESRLAWVPPSSASADRQDRPSNSARSGTAPPAAPVLLVHGYLGTPAGWEPLVPGLHEAGIGDVFTFGYNALASTIPLLAADVVGAAHEAMTRSSTDRVHLVGHSLGGLVIRYAVQRLGLAAAASAVVTVATPHLGSPFAVVAPGIVGAQMRPGSALLAHLPALASTSGVRWLVVDCEQDLVVSRLPSVTGENRIDDPGAGAAGARDAAGSTGEVTHLVVTGVGHQGILRSDQLRRAVVEHLVATPPLPAVAREADAA